ncbi:hypothetical protein SDC9_83856 [bioreactor metagenome]|uniref:Uncharacterized protein n=1 Tax=bioreactor metagenome TaxID=1076179 RepID=A0A644Z9B0_9ZZZZ
MDMRVDETGHRIGVGQFIDLQLGVDAESRNAADGQNAFVLAQYGAMFDFFLRREAVGYGVEPPQPIFRFHKD